MPAHLPVLPLDVETFLQSSHLANFLRFESSTRREIRGLLRTTDHDPFRDFLKEKMKTEGNLFTAESD